MTVIIVNDMSIADGTVTDHSKCEQCKIFTNNKRMCYCEDCDIQACVFCVYTFHLGTETRTAHDVFWRDSMAPLEPADLVKCGYIRCRDFRYEHNTDGCIICESSVKKEQPNEEADLLRCHGFIDEQTMTDDERFWKSFDFSCGVTTNSVRLKKGEEPPAPHTSREVMKYVAMVRHWGWSDAKIERILRKMMDGGKIVEVPESVYHRAPKFAKVLVKVEKADNSLY